jgi:hypothetical protein
MRGLRRSGIIAPGFIALAIAAGFLDSASLSRLGLGFLTGRGVSGRFGYYLPGSEFFPVTQPNGSSKPLARSISKRTARSTSSDEFNRTN